MKRVYPFTGVDPRFPYLTQNERYRFPDPAKSRGDLVAIGGNLSPGMLLSAYEAGLFPWYNEYEPVLWYCPDPRFILEKGELHVSTSMKKILKQKRFEIRFDYDFPSVIKACSEIRRPGQHGTWITEDIIKAYTKLFELRYVHCAEAYLDGELAGGCYGVLLGKVFFGESMFAKVSNASKAAFITYAQKLFGEGIELIDCQIPTEHLSSLGGKEIPRKDFLTKLSIALGQ